MRAQSRPLLRGIPAGILSTCAHLPCPPFPSDPTPGNSGSNAQLGACPVPAVQSGPTLSYELGGPIFVTGPSTGAGATPVPLTVPFPAFSGECSDSYQPGFLFPLPSNEQVWHRATPHATAEEQS